MSNEQEHDAGSAGYTATVETTMELLRTWLGVDPTAVQHRYGELLYEDVRRGLPEIVELGITGIQWDVACQMVFGSLDLQSPEPVATVTDAAGRKACFIAAMEDLRGPGVLEQMRALALAKLAATRPAKSRWN